VPNSKFSGSARSGCDRSDLRRQTLYAKSSQSQVLGDPFVSHRVIQWGTGNVGVPPHALRSGPRSCLRVKMQQPLARRLPISEREKHRRMSYEC
jgi:hypothetical protein